MISSNPPNDCGDVVSRGEAALCWFKFGVNVIPLVPGTKRTALKWNPWLHNLSRKKIINHWADHPDHEVGFIVGDDIIVFDADSPEAVAALAAIEKACDVEPNLVVNTSKGEHHFFKRAAGTQAKSDSHSTKDHPERIDVKTGRALVVLPPSTGKSIALNEAGTARELTEVGQEFIDAVSRHNGRMAPRPSGMALPASPRVEPSSARLRRIGALLGYIDADLGYEDWLHVLMAIFHESGGSVEGLQIANEWSSKGKKYRGVEDIRTKWASFKAEQETFYTMATLIRMVTAAGFDWVAVCDAVEPQFEPCEHVVIGPAGETRDAAAAPATSLDRYSLKGQTQEIERQAVEAVPILGHLALKGQVTIFYAAPNTGKTLITLNLIITGIERGTIEASRTYYINVDDSSTGLLQKARIADEYGFHMLAEGFREFKAREFGAIVHELMENDQAHGVVIILDTLKKFVDLMDKVRCGRFTEVLRRFALKGGTLIALAHTNKHPGANGKLIYGGTSDIVDDCDCAYVLAPISEDAGETVIEFQNIKRRGDVAQTAAYRYARQAGMSYHELLMSVEAVDALEVAPLKQAAQVRSDAEVIGVITECIAQGINSKMNLIKAASTRAGISRRSAEQVLDAYTGDDPAVHHWNFDVRGRGAKVYTLREHTPPEQAPPRP